MGPYDHRSVTLDPGLTALALRALREREGHYPFVGRFTRRRRRARGATRPGPAGVAAPAPPTGAAPAPFWPRSLRPAELFPTFSRIRGLRGASSAAA